MKYITLFLILFIVNVQAQQPDKNWGRKLVMGIKNLKVGDKVPNVLIANIVNNNTPSAKISDFKNQLLVLDFWDTNCSACIEGMPKLDSLQRKFANKVKILSVTWQKKSEIVAFFKTNRFLNTQKIPVRRASVVEDRILGSYFRHKGLPHVVWINKGVVTAITNSQYLNAENIQTLLDGKTVNWPFKNDSFDTGSHFVTLNDADQYPQNSRLFSYSVLTGQTNAVSTVVNGLSFVQDKINHTSRIALFNESIVNVYRYLSSHSDSISRKFLTIPGRIVLEVKDQSKYVYDPKKDTQAAWNLENEICYEMLRSELTTERIMAKIAMRDLDNKLGLYGRWEKRKIKCLVIVKTTDKIAIDTVPAAQEGTTISDIAFFLLDFTRRYPPAIDETNFKGKIKLGVHDDSLEGLKKALQEQGFDIIEADREIEALVITEVNNR